MVIQYEMHLHSEEQKVLKLVIHLFVCSVTIGKCFFTPNSCLVKLNMKHGSNIQHAPKYLGAARMHKQEHIISIDASLLESAILYI